MAAVASAPEGRRLTDLRVVDLKSELKRRNLDTSGVKNVLIARLKQAIEEEGGDPDNIQLFSDTPSKKTPKSKGKKNDADEAGGDASMEEDGNSKMETDIDAIQSDSQDTSDQDGAEDQKTTEAEEKEAEEDENEKEEGLAEAHQTVQDETAPSASLKEADDDNISVTIQAEDAITLDFDGDDLLETGKNPKTPDCEVNKPKAEKEPQSQEHVEGEVKNEGKKEKNHKEGRKEEGMKAESKKEAREGSRKAEGGDKERDSSKKGPSSAGASSQAKSSSKDSKDKTATKDEKGGVSSSSGSTSGNSSSSTKNLWISGLSSNTKAADLKNLFSKYGKVLSAKVVTNARSPGARCYGFVTMSSSTEVSRCISHLHRTELHGQQISVEKVKSDPFKKDCTTKDGSGKTSSSRNGSDKKSSSSGKTSSKVQLSSKKEDKKTEKLGDKKESKDGSNSMKKQEKRDEKENTSSNHDHSKKADEKRRRSVKSPHRMVVIDKAKGEPVVSVKTVKKGKSEPVSTSKSKEKSIPSKPSSKERKDILPFEKIKQQKIRERLVRLQRIRRAIELRRRREIAERQRRERERIRILREREERDRLQRERERLEIEKQKLERERMERERLERERIRIEQERRKEIERIAREREELRRQQEQLRYEQERRNSLKRPRDVDNRRDEPYWNEHKRRTMDSDARFSHNSDYSRQDPHRFNDFDHRVQSSSFDGRGDRYNHQGEGKKNRSGSRREDSGYNRYPKPYGDSRRPASQQRIELHGNNERREMRDRDERRTVTLQDRSSGSRGHDHLPKISPSRSFPDRGRMSDHGVQHGRPSHNSSRPNEWKPSGMGSSKREIRNSRDRDRMRPERSGHSIRSGPPSGHSSMSGYSSRDGGRPVMERGSNQQSHYHDSRHPVVERHGRESGAPRNSWHSGPSSQGSGYQDMRRMSDNRGPGMMPPSSPSVTNRIVQITNNSMQGGSVSGSKGIHGSGDVRFKPFKGGAPRRF
ncbi:SAFB-like transcription modulator isoform X2 [Callorhinchus milii]|uniref:SAFB-like transcription modulator isoform X2 n=1 Tax=Callorhinchus milii TaxID=7868 RepID=UPI001C3F7C62|nr:SAFB-like transcription modulator isoform X2 [Callorhinchus milii]